MVETNRPLQVGIIGASPSSGWARESHVPAVRSLRGLALGAVVTRGRSQAEAAAEAYGARVGYADPEALFADPEIDVVTVAVKVPDHHDLVLGAIAAGKHVYCEWPLSPTLAQARELADAAERAGVRVAIGLQARAHPAIRAARELIGRGAIGRVLGARALSTTAAWGPATEPAMVFAEKPEAGVNLVIVQAAHTLDLMTSLVGSFADAFALATRQFHDIAVRGEDRSVVRETFDALAVIGSLESGGTYDAQIIGGRPPDRTPFELVIMGDEGELAITGGAARGFQSGRLALSLNGTPHAVDEGELARLSDAAFNVANVYARLRDDILAGERESPDFDHAVRLTRMIEDLLAGSSAGERITGHDWPNR